MVVCALACNKSNDSNPKYDPAPTITSYSVGTDVANGITRPKFTVTLTIPDTLAVKEFVLGVGPTFSIPLVILSPKSGTYTLIDPNNVYPLQPGRKTYTPFFVMADNTSLYNSSINAQ